MTFAHSSFAPEGFKVLYATYAGCDYVMNQQKPLRELDAILGFCEKYIKKMKVDRSLYSE